MHMPASRTFTAPEVTLPDGTAWEAHTLHYLEYQGTGTGAQTLICVHGLTRNAWDFHYVINRLMDQYDRIISLDVAGRGASAWLKHPEHYGYPLYVSDVYALIKHLNVTQIDWLGTSMGGLIGMMVAATTPQLIGKMVINDIGAFIPSASLMRIGKYCGKEMTFDSRAAMEARLRSSLATFSITQEEHWQHIFAHAALAESRVQSSEFSAGLVSPASPGPAEAARQLKASMPEGAQNKFHLAYDPKIGDAFWNNRGKQRKMPDMPLWELWNKVHTPTLLLRGAESDLLLAETAEQMKQNPALKKLVTFPYVGHAPALMEENQIAVVREWFLH